MEAPSRRSVPLPFTDKPVLDLRATASALDIEPVPEGEQPRIEFLDDRADLPVEVRPGPDAVQVIVGVPDFSWFPFFGGGRHFGLRLLLPSNIRARIHSDMGRVRVERLAGCDLELATHAGQILLRDVRGRLAIRADAGQVRGEGLAGSLSVQSGAGEVRLGIEGLDPGEHRVDSSMGAVKVTLAPGLKVRIESRTSMGSTRNRYPSSGDAEAVLKLQADLGSVRVDEAGAGNDTRHGDGADWRKYWAAEPPMWRRRPSRPGRSGANEEELRRILTLIEQGKINAGEGERLIRALEGR